VRRDDRLGDLVERQLDLFVRDDADLVAEAQAAEEAWNDAGSGDAEEAYGDYLLVVDAIADRLLEIREAYAGTLEVNTAELYRATFNRLAGRRFRRYPSIAGDLADS
jgi:CRISPR/Cas system endoribonuclease Cas6 (RAMP superfamily)